MKAHREIRAPALSVRNLRQHQFVEFRIVGVRLDHGVDHGANEFIERRSRMLHELGCEEAVDLLYVALVQGFKDGGSVREVLVERANTDACNLSDPVGGDRLKALALQDPDHSIEDRLDGLACPALLRLAPNGRLRTFRWHEDECRANVSIHLLFIYYCLFFIKIR